MAARRRWQPLILMPVVSVAAIAFLVSAVAVIERWVAEGSAHDAVADSPVNAPSNDALGRMSGPSCTKLAACCGSLEAELKSANGASRHRVLESAAGTCRLAVGRGQCDTSAVVRMLKTHGLTDDAAKCE